MSHHLAHHIFAKLFQKVAHEEITPPIVRDGLTGGITPGVELRIRCTDKGALGAAGIVSIEGHGQLRQALINPRLLVGIVVPMDHMLEFVGKDGIEPIAARPGSIDIDKEHFFFIAIGVYDA